MLKYKRGRVYVSGTYFSILATRWDVDNNNVVFIIQVGPVI